MKKARKILQEKRSAKSIITLCNYDQATPHITFLAFHPKTIVVSQLQGEKQASYSSDNRFIGNAVKIYSYLHYILLITLTLIGIPLGFKTGWFRILLLYLLYYLAMFFLILASTRYRIQFEPVFAAFAGIALAYVFEKVGFYRTKKDVTSL